MDLIARSPLDARLRPYVRRLWHYQDAGTTGTAQALPSAAMQLLINLKDDHLHWLRPSDEPMRLPGAIVQGMHTRPFGLDRADQQAVIGAVLEPTAAGAFCATPANLLAEQHVALEDLWSSAAAGELADRLRQVATADARLDCLERILIARLGPADPPDALVRAALHRMASPGDTITILADDFGISVRRFRRRFRAEVGLNPKAMAGVLRFQRSLTALRRGDRLWEVALDCGYYDQAHFTHEFRSLSGVTPVAYRQLNPAHRNHLP